MAGVALNSLGQGLPGVEIRLFPLNSAPSGAATHKVFSDQSGRFMISSLAPGLYRLVAVKGGYSVLVGQVNTLLQDTLKLILSPSGAPGPPGSRPADASWALRLPHRDLLEDRGFEPVTSPATDDRVVAGLLRGSSSDAITFEALASRLGGAGGESPGEGGGFALAGALFTADRGLISGRVSRVDEGRDNGLSDKATSLRLRWVPEVDAGQVLALAADWFQRETAQGAVQVRQSSDLDGVHAALSRTLGRDSRVTDLRLDISSARLSESDALGVEAPQDLSVFKAVAGFDVQRSWREAHEFVLNVVGRGISGAQTDSVDRPQVALLPSDAVTESDSLAEVADSGVFLSVGDRWRVSPNVTLVPTVRGEWSGGPASGVRGNATIGAQWGSVESAMFRAEGGVAMGGDRAGAPIGRVGVEGGGPTWNLNLARDHDVGPVVWRTPMTEVGLADPMLAGRDATTDRWTAGVHWRSSSRAPEIRVQGAWIRVHGAVAPRIPGDLPLVPVDGGGAAAGRRIEVGLALARTRTEVTFFWDELKDQSSDGRVLLEGADRWTRRAVSVRQRLILWGAEGPNCDLVIGAEENSLGPDVPPSSSDVLRQSVLQRRRVSGGVALTF